MNPTQVIKYACPTCEELHEYEHQAETCCTPEVDEVTVWKCADCGETYDDQDHARLCCWDGESDLEPYRHTPEQLEAAGQQRLPL